MSFVSSHFYIGFLDPKATNRIGYSRIGRWATPTSQGHCLLLEILQQDILPETNQNASKDKWLEDEFPFLLSLSVGFQRNRIISQCSNHPSFLRGTLVVSFREDNFDVETSRDIVCCMASKKVQLSMATLSGTLQIENSLHQLKAYFSAWNGTSWPFSKQNNAIKMTHHFWTVEDPHPEHTIVPLRASPQTLIDMLFSMNLPPRPGCQSAG